MRSITINFSITSEKAARWIYKQKMQQAKHLHWIIQTTFTCEKITQYQYFIFLISWLGEYGDTVTVGVV